MPQAPRVSGLSGVEQIGSLAWALFTNVVGRLAGGKKLPVQNEFQTLGESVSYVFTMSYGF